MSQMPPSPDPRLQLDESRRRFAESWSEVRTATRRETGWFPKGIGWTLLLAAAAGGVALAYGRYRQTDRALTGD